MFVLVLKTGIGTKVLGMGKAVLLLNLSTQIGREQRVFALNQVKECTISLYQVNKGLKRLCIGRHTKEEGFNTPKSRQSPKIQSFQFVRKPPSSTDVNDVFCFLAP